MRVDYVHLFQLCVQQHHTNVTDIGCIGNIYPPWKSANTTNQGFLFLKEPTANHLLAHPWWQQAALSWSQWYFSDLMMVNMREEELKTLTGV